jgi:hypothetical protein
MIRQNENRSPQLGTKPSWRKEGPAAALYRAASPSPRRACKPEKGPAFLKMYVMPMLLLNLAVVGWTLVTRNIVAQGIMVYLGYALIVAIGLRLYLVYLDHYLFRASSVQSGRKVQSSTGDQDHPHKSERWQDARRITAGPGPERRQPGQVRTGVFI